MNEAREKMSRIFDWFVIKISYFWCWLLISILLLVITGVITAVTQNFVLGSFALIISLFISVWLLLKFVKQLFGIFLKSFRVPAHRVQHSLAEIDQMKGYEFEKCMQDVFERLGYSVEQTPLSCDQGADLILTSKKGTRTAVQVKRYSSKVSNKAVQEVVAAKGFHKCTEGIVVTNNYFTNPARQLAEANNIDLMDRNELMQMINKIS
ncbi:MAG: restriction endonuclease [Methanosarcina sp.]|uniref:restriction endonuclease n=1 Tax=Methanosarcina sp. TaxID=2213 RepID=UPI003BB601E8